MIRVVSSCVVFLIFMTSSLPASAAGVVLFQSEDQLFSQAVKDFADGHFTEAQARFEQIKGVHAQDAKDYLEKIKIYTDKVKTANAIMARDPDELDARTLDSAIQEYKEALKISANGPGNPTSRLAKAEELRKKLTAANPVEAPKPPGPAGPNVSTDLCNKSLQEASEHRYTEAAADSCKLAFDHAGTTCGGVDVATLCEEQKKLAGNTGGFARALAAYTKNNFDKARSLFGQVPAETRASADAYLDKISHYQNYMAQADQLSKKAQYEDARMAFGNAANIKADGPGNPRAGALRMELLEGLDEFYSGDYVASRDHLEDYVQSGGEKPALARFYLGASKLGRFFLTGNSDDSLRQDALKDFREAKQAGYKAQPQDVSPKIMQAYRDLAF
jgi:tetratricopeptide (TPR) repeat protein